MKKINDISYAIIGCAYKVHRILGPGLLESAYQSCLEDEMISKGLFVQHEVAVPLVYNGRKLEVGYRVDLVVENSIIIEIKSIDAIAPIHKAQLLTYLRLTGIKLGLLINFNVINLKEGIHRLVLGDITNL
ncbi:MAG: GxxExxY protein [Bacteroidetes bacterium]|nr:GxxExxY protein [Bacteroidota bacterium]